MFACSFSEMPTNNYVESSFWNFDALFQPQQHPARDAHDTFFVSRTYDALFQPQQHPARDAHDTFSCHVCTTYAYSASLQRVNHNNIKVFVNFC